MVDARTQHARVEDLSARTPTTATYANPNGTWTVEAYSGVVRAKGKADSWVAVDPSVEKAGRAFMPRATPFDAKFSGGGDSTVGSVRTPGNDTIKVGWPTRLPVPTAAGSSLTYPGAVPDGDLVVGSHADGFDYSIVLDKAPTGANSPEYRIPLSFGGATPTVQKDGSIVLLDGKKRVATMTAPVMWDAKNAAADGERHPVTATVEGSGDNRTLVLKPDLSFLQNPSTTYPVTVDPTIALNVAYDTWVDSTSPTTSQISSTELRVGSNNSGGNIDRSYLYFDFSSLSGMPPAVVSSAQLQLSDFGTGSCTGSAVRVSQVTGSYNIANMTWATQPTTTATGSSTSTASFGATGCSTEGTVTFDATAIYNSWLAGAFNWGVQLKADNETAASGYRQFRSAENGDISKAPKMVLTYNSYPNKPISASISLGGSYNSTNYADSLTPTVSTVATDPDGGAVRGYFEIYNSAGTTLLWSGSSPWGTSGDQLSATVPSGVLVDGTSYVLASYSQDAALKSKSANLKTFTVDASPPSTTITSNTYTNNTWSSASTSAQVTLDGPTDTVSFDTLLDGVPTTFTANASGDMTFSAVYASGWHTYQVNAIDRAGNRGPTATFSFGAGQQDFTTPAPNARSTSAFPLDVVGPANATSAYLQWRLQNETTWRSANQVTQSGTTWTGAVTTSGGKTDTGALLWNATGEAYGTGTLTAPAVITIRACFQYSAGPSCTYARTVQLVPSAFGGNFPTADLGPASVALFSGEASIDGVDAADSAAGLGRTFSSYDAATVDTGVFGPGWSDPEVLMSPSDDTQADVIDDRAKDGSFVIVDADGGSQTFVPVAGSTTSYAPLQPTGDATSLTFTPGSAGAADTLALVRPLGSGTITTTWSLQASDTGGTPQWTFVAVDAPGTSGDLAATNDHQRPTFIRESDPSVAATCNATTQTTGCRGLAITYTGTGSAMRVASLARVIGAATQAGVTSTTIATYSYDGSGRLSTVCSAAPAAGKPALCTTYTYTTVGGRTLLATVQPAGQIAWRFDYDTTGRLITVKRTKPTGGDAIWSVDYGLTPSSSGLPDLTASTAAQWGQQTVPTKVFAVYQPVNGTADVTNADLYYTTPDGTTTNTASYGPSGWLVDTNWYDANGNVVRSLDGPAWAQVQAAATANRPTVAAQESSYTVYNTWGDANTVGTRVVDQYGPAHTATLKNGTIGLFRTHTHTMYDDDPNVDTSLISGRPGSTGLGLEVEQTTSASDVGMTTDQDSVVTKYGYDPIVTGDGNGWTLGAPTKVSSQLGSGWSDAITRYDSSGRVIESRQPGGAADGTGAGNDAHATVTTYYTASGSGDCGGKPAWDGLVCKVGPAAQPAGTTMPLSYTTNYNDNLQPTVVQEISGGTVTRTTTTTYDNIGRVTGVTKTTTGSAVTDETIATTYSYDDNTGLPTTTTSGGKTITTGYDAWGRTISYTDALGTTSSTTYDSAGNEATFNDGTATYTYTYDSHNLLSSVDAGGGVGTFSYAYTAGGDLDTVTYPNGVVAKRTYDQAGTPTGLTYSQGSTQLLGFSASVDAAGRTIAQASNASNQQFSYDDLGRLTSTQDTRANGCTTRTYGFDASSNRNTFASYNPGTSGACQTTTATLSKTNSYDSAGRITNSGYTYDTLGRTLTTPQTDAGPNAASALSATYHADDMVASLSQSVRNASGAADADVMTYALDPAERINTITTTTNGVESNRLRYRFGDDSDAPVAIDSSSDGGNSWTVTRNVNAPDVGMVACTTTGANTLQLANLHGDVVATMPDTSGTSTVSSYTETDEYGNALTSGSTPRYGWLGSAQRSGDAIAGLMLMGSRLFNRSTGAFLTIDPGRGGNATVYGYPLNPNDEFDLNGQHRSCHFWCSVTIDTFKVVGWGACALLASAFTWVCGAVIDGIADVAKYVYEYNHGEWTMKGAIERFLVAAGEVLVSAAIAGAIANVGFRVLSHFGYKRTAAELYEAIMMYYRGRHRG